VLIRDKASFCYLQYETVQSKKKVPEGLIGSGMKNILGSGRKMGRLRNADLPGRFLGLALFFVNMKP
jgi:hypothetical protein